MKFRTTITSLLLITCFVVMSVFAQMETPSTEQTDDQMNDYLWPNSHQHIVNGTYIRVNEDFPTLIFHTGLGQKAVGVYMYGTVGALGFSARTVSFSTQTVLINNYELVIGEPDSGGPGLRSLSVMNSPRQIAFDGRPIS